MARKITQHDGSGVELWSWNHYSSVTRDHWKWPNFTPSEMRCRATGRLVISPDFMDSLQAIRTKTGIPMPINSGYRSPLHNARVSHTKKLDGPHTDSQAADVAVSRADSYAVIKAALEQGFLGIGPKQHGATRYVHLDRWYRREDGTFWTYFEE